MKRKVSIMCLSTALSLAFCCPISTHAATKTQYNAAVENAKTKQFRK